MHNVTKHSDIKLFFISIVAKNTKIHACSALCQLTKTFKALVSLVTGNIGLYHFLNL